MPRFDIPTTAGAKRHRITLETAVDVADAYGQVIRTWGATATYWASIDQDRTEMDVNAAQVKAERTGLITMRYFGPIDATMQRFSFRGRIMHIKGVEDVGELHKEYRIQYHEMVGAAAI